MYARWLLLVLLFFLSAVFGAEVEQELVWGVTVGGQPAGEHTLKIKYIPSADGSVKRILESYAEYVGVTAPPVAMKRRVTGHAGLGPAILHSVLNDNGEAREIQAALDEGSWRITLTEEGKSMEYELASSRVDMSDLDLFDPASGVPIGRYHLAKILSVETGDVMEGEVVRMGNSELEIEGTKVLVDEYIWSAPSLKWSLFYTPDGFLVRYERSKQGVDIVGQLREPPPKGLDEAPVSRAGEVIEEIDL